MSEEPIPADVQNFILKHIDSVAQLEALLLMRRNPSERWDAAKMAKRIYTSEAESAALLARLAADGFLEGSDGLFRFECTDRNDRETIDSLASTYSRHLIPMTNLIHGKPRRIRQFADAFKFRKDR